jgi:hypothetical protein
MRPLPLETGDGNWGQTGSLPHSENSQSLSAKLVFSNNMGARDRRDVFPLRFASLSLLPYFLASFRQRTDRDIVSVGIPE